MPQGFQIGPFMIRFYALFIIAGALLGAWLAAKLAEKDGQNGESVWDMLPWLLIAGIIGARLWHVFTPSASNAAMGITTENYLKHPLQILEIWKGGLGIPGGVVGGVIAAMIYCTIKKMHFGQWADFFAPGLLVAQAIGRWGNFFNQELYGGPSDLPWAIKIAPEYRLPGFSQIERYHPLFLYEFVLNLIAAGILVLLSAANRKKKFLFKGDIFLLYLVLYPTIRFFLEFLRLDPSPVNGYNINQTTMGVVAVLAILALIIRHLIKKPMDPSLETEGVDVSDIPFVESENLDDNAFYELNEEALEAASAEELQSEVEEIDLLDEE
ncbi:MAG: prolipoprotein diacylglyceryl transferase [Anaerolineaceae bacterium]|nr:prolipoprotein diacylglyceryl transferase [Anaerolineaceae bacterium]